MGMNEMVQYTTEWDRKTSHPALEKLVCHIDGNGAELEMTGVNGTEIRRKICDYDFRDSRHTDHLLDSMYYELKVMDHRAWLDRMFRPVGLDHAYCICDPFAGLFGSKSPEGKFDKVRVDKKNGRDITVVFWDDGTKTILKKEEGDENDIYLAVAIAHMIKRFGSNSAYKTHVKKMRGKPYTEVSYAEIALYETAQIYGGITEFGDRLMEKLEVNHRE